MPRPRPLAIVRIALALALLSAFWAPSSADQCSVSFSSPEDHELVSTEALVINFIALYPSMAGHATVNVTCGDPPRPVFDACIEQKDLGPLLPSPFQVVIPDDSAMSCKGDHLNVTACYYGYNLNPNISTCNLGLNNTACMACSSLVLDVSGDGVSIAYVVCSSLSMAGCLVLIFLYIRYPVLRKFPSNLVFWRTVVDLIFSLQFIWINGWEIDNASSPQYCNGGVAFITQFSGAASLGWYLVMALNFYFSVDNPFVRPQTKVVHYHVGVWSASIITGIIASFQYGYRSDFRLCWIKKTSGINLFNWLLYFVWLIIFAVVSIYILWSGSRKLNANTGFAKNLAKTLAKRETALRQTQIYIFVFSFYWTIAAIIWAVVYFISQASDAHEIQQKPLAYFFTIIISVLGLIDVATWLFIQWEPLQKAREQSNRHKSSSDRLEDEADEEFSDISDALRHEFISCTSHGISFTATHPYRPSARPKSLMVPGAEHANDGSTGGYVPPNADSTRRAGRHSDAYVPVSEDRGTKYVKLLAEEEQVIDLNIKTTEDDSANYKFIAYAPRLFENIRELFKLRSGHEYADSLGGDAREMKKNFSEGASGSFFYRTADDKFMVKTLTETEFQFLLEILPRYQAHFQQFPESLICKFYGLYSIEMYGHREYFAVMGNVLCSPEYPIDEKYDLKGSSVNRHGKSKKKGGNVSVYKDNDIKKYVRISPTDAQRIVRQLEIDSKFMCSVNIMDYSLLLGIHNCTESRVPSSHCNGLSAEEKFRRHNPTLGDASPARLKSNTSVSALGFPMPSDIHGARYGGTATTTPTHWQAASSPPPASPAPREELPAPVALQRVGADGVAPERQPLLDPSGDDCKRPDYESNRYNTLGTSRQASPSSASEVSVITDSFPSVMAASVIVGPGIYHMGIIDMLQQWDWKKKLELWTKIVLCHCRDWQWISAVEPSLYQERFVRKMKKVFNVAQDPAHKEQGLL